MSDTNNQQGNFVIGVAKNSTVSISKFNQNYQDNNVEKSIEEVIYEICEQLQQKYCHASELKKQTVFEMEIQRIINEDSKFKQRIGNSLKAGGYELTKIITNNPFVSVPLEMFKGWIES